MMYLFSQLLVVDAAVLHNGKRKELNLSLCLFLMLRKVLPATIYKHCSLSSILYIWSSQHDYLITSIPLPTLVFLDLWKHWNYIRRFASAKSAKSGNLLWNDVFSAGQGWWWIVAGIKREEIPFVRFVLLPHATSTRYQTYHEEAWD